MVSDVSISKTVKEVIDNDLSLQDALGRRYGNYTAIARLIKPKVERDIGRKVNFESLITSVKRVKPRLQQAQGGIEGVMAGSVVNVRTDVAKLNLEKSKRSLEAARNVMATYQEEFLQISESNSAITLIFDQKLLGEIHRRFNDNYVLDEQTNLAAIIVHSPTEIVRTPGVVLAIYAKIAENHINIEDTVSCFTDTIVVIRMEEVARTFSVLTDLISDCRARSKRRQRVAI
ncbi:MAG: ACT domain-containing protein [Nitrososphaerota archaeon]|nr:ACT domain-containing protein [Nitrososphaerota archaeon]MDG6923522.1 ACT domain-containing protein [Nitrososphaerota archaeon]